jgi:3-hydroxyacyl-CoA dehydrogenase / 3-hydroxy-2-methylbutyryl-CoA dehydrogenase
MEIKDKIAVITGGASGLGLATARHLVLNGAKVAIWDLNGEAGEKTVNELGENALFCQVDVSDEESVAKAMEVAVSHFGTINVAINCAGIGIPAKLLGKEGPVDMKGWTKTIQINLVGTVNVIRLAAQQMNLNEPNPDGERGVIVNTASVAAYEGQIGQTAYAASKAGIIGVTLPAAREFAPLGIRVVTIAPGLFETPMMMGLPEKVQEALGLSVPFPSRLGRPTEYAGLVGHIIENPMINGETIRLDGALRMAPR